MSLPPRPQSRLKVGQQAKVTSPIGVFNPAGTRLDALKPGEVVTLLEGPTIDGQDIRWRVTDPNGPGSGYTFEYRQGQYYLEPIGAPPATGGTTVYIVKDGDTWWGIAQKHHTTVDALKALNRGSDIIRPGDVLHVGDKMRVPA